MTQRVLSLLTDRIDTSNLSRYIVLFLGKQRLFINRSTFLSYRKQGVSSSEHKNRYGGSGKPKITVRIVSFLLNSHMYQMQDTQERAVD